MSTKVKSILAREILDSRGTPTVEVEVKLDTGKKAWAAVPSGASTGIYETIELRDGDKKRYQGKGVLKAISNVNKIIAPKLIGKDPTKQRQIDNLMMALDGTKNKSRLGTNAILGISLAVARAAAIGQGLPLYQYLRPKFFKDKKRWDFPIPMMNILNGGAHAGWNLDIQEFMILPQQKNIKERIRCGVEIFWTLKKILQNKGYSVAVGDEGGFAPKLKNNESALKLVIQAIKKANYQVGRAVKLALDLATSELFDPQTKLYTLKKEKKKFTSEQLIEFFQNWLKKYPIVSLEDPLAEDDWPGWQIISHKPYAIPARRSPPEADGGGNHKLLLVGDDLFVTNVSRLKQGIRKKVANTILIKPNQIGTLSETIDCIKLAQKNKYKVIISHRSGETVDDFISDLAVASGAEFIKTGAPCRGERVAKYNRLMEIESEIKS